MPTGPTTSNGPTKDSGKMFALTLSVRRQEEHPACKTEGRGGGVGVVICLERGADCLHMVQLMPLPSQNPIISYLV